MIVTQLKRLGLALLNAHAIPVKKPSAHPCKGFFVPPIWLHWTPVCTGATLLAVAALCRLKTRKCDSSRFPLPFKIILTAQFLAIPFEFLGYPFLFMF